jgi:hypothetical protein
VPTRIYRAISAATNDGRLALVNALIVTVPTDDAPMLRYKAAIAAASANMKVKVLTRDSLGLHARNATQ